MTMRILDKYIFRQFAKAFFFSSLVFLCLFVLVNMVEKLDKFIDNNLSLQQIARYYLLSIPSIVLVTSPISALLSSILVSGKLSMSSELPAIRSAGVSMRQLLQPFLLGGVFILVINLVNAWWIAPATFSVTRSFEKHHFSKNDSDVKENRNIHLLEPGNQIVSIGEFDPERLTLNTVSIAKLSGAKIISRIDADSMHYDTKTREWIMQNVSTRLFTNEHEEFRFKPSQVIKLALSPAALKELDLQPDEMDIVRHYGYLAEKQRAGFAGLERSMVKFHNKTAMPFASLIIMLIGVPLAAKKKRGGLASEITIALFAGFLYIGLQRTVAMAGYQGALNPLFAAWLPNLLFLGIGYMIYKTSID